jgi:Predicted outer membrane protein
MNKKLLLLLALLTACMLQACHGNSIQTNSDDEDDDTVTANVDTSKNSSIVIGNDDIRFITGMAEACLVEIKIGNMAKQRGADKRVRNFGAMMVKDLTKGRKRLDSLARIKKIALPDSISWNSEVTINQLAQKTGKDFDRAYLEKMSSDYKNAIAQFQYTAKSAYDPQIKAFANRHLMTVQRHLDLIDAIHSTLK